ncbi:MAG: pyrroline-5-carboxylate reductase [Myxococcota bacterium]|jgi:pyrroline-5-carboxylate reductase
MKLAVIGAGNMAQALVRGALDAGVLNATDVVACRRDPERLAAVGKSLGVATTHDIREAVNGADAILFAVKPQQAVATLTHLGDSLRGDQVLISVLAGTTTSTLESVGSVRLPVVRAMPNTPAFVGQGMAFYCLGAHGNEEHAAIADRFFGASGKVLRTQESDIDAMTAVSGCGPAYLFYVAEAMMAGAEALGISAETARILVDQTLLGASTYLTGAPEDAATLRRQVTSPGGATAEAIRCFDEANLRVTFVSAMKAAADRAQALGQKL